MQSRQRWAYLELQKVKMSQTLKSKKTPPFCINSDKLETTLAPPPDWTKVNYTSITQKSNIPVVMSSLWILLVVVAQLVVMAIFS